MDKTKEQQELTSRIGNRNLELAAKWFLRPLARFPVAWIASTETARFTSVASWNHRKEDNKINEELLLSQMP